MNRPRRLGAQDYIGIRQYYLTICTRKRLPELADPATVDLIAEQFLRVAAAEEFAVIAYCFMPDHLHAVVSGRSPDCDFQRFVRLAKQRSGFAFARVRGRRLWQDSFFDRHLRGDGDLPSVIRYMIENPIRAGLVKTAGEYAHWGSQVHSREEILDFIARERRV